MRRIANGSYPSPMRLDCSTQFYCLLVTSCQDDLCGRALASMSTAHAYALCAHIVKTSVDMICVECGKKSGDQRLYREFSGGTIQLSQCVSHSPPMQTRQHKPL